MKNQILVIGTVAYDSIHSPSGSSGTILGGSGMYISVAASYFNSEVVLNSIVGKDFDSAHTQWLNSLGVDTTQLDVHPTENTFFWEGKYLEHLNDRETLDTQLNVLPFYQPKLNDKARASQFVLLGNVAPNIQLDIIEQMKDTKPFVAVDTMNFWIESAKEQVTEVFRHSDLIIINDSEARDYTGEYQLGKCAEQLLALGAQYVIIKKGEHGALLFDGKRIFNAPALILDDVKDPTGAGDCFAGGLIGRLSESEQVSFDAIKEAILYGSSVASHCVEDFGVSRLKQTTQTDVLNRVSELKSYF